MSRLRYHHLKTKFIYSGLKPFYINELHALRHSYFWVYKLFLGMKTQDFMGLNADAT